MKSAVEAVRRGMLLARQIQDEFTQQDTLTKNDRSPVTIADFAIQVLVVRRLLSQFPHIPVVAEEEAEILRHPDHAGLLDRVYRFLRPFFPDLQAAEIHSWIDRGSGEPGDLFWVLDPIDGTKGFLRGDHFAIALALIHRGVVELGVIGCPRLTECGGRSAAEGFLFSAVQGHGARVQPVFEGHPEPIAVSNQETLSRLTILESYESAHSDFSLRQKLQEKLSCPIPPRQIDGQVKYGILASGGADLYLRIPPPQHSSYREKIWDHAAGVCIVKAAGGCVTDIYGRPLDFTRGRALVANCGILASNGRIHEPILRQLSHLLPTANPELGGDGNADPQPRNSDLVKMVSN